MRYFYVIYIKDNLTKNFLNAIRLIGNPNEKHDAHITVRGPYSEPIEKRFYDIEIENSLINVQSVDSFLNNSQNTVFLRCDSTKLRYVWNKPDYGYNPHITLYDGPSRNFAEKLISILNSYSLTFSFMVNEISELVSTNNLDAPKVELDLTLGYINRIVGDHIESKKDILIMTEPKRLLLIEALIQDLSFFKSRRGLKVTLCEKPIENEGLKNPESNKYGHHN